MSFLVQYTRAMAAGHLDTCIAIERAHDLYGYPPQLVSVGLKAADEGKDPVEAVEVYIEEQGASNA